MTLSVIVHGPQGCGKSRNSELLMRHFGCKRVIDNAELLTPAWLKRKATEIPTLFLTNECKWPDGSPVEPRCAMVVPYADAMASATEAARND